ncbi:hypothetical protein [Nonomuraea sp. NPDC049400]|uniref:hypothetical protein n=1 Tax=Nonomuraea sp. NPDC049400 TaxID=3364352 RepID=UPI00379FCA38
MSVLPLLDDLTYPASASAPARTFYADGTRVALRSAEGDVAGTTYGIQAGPHDALQAVLWDDGRTSLVASDALNRLAAPVPVTPRDAARTAQRVTRFAARFLAETPERHSHPEPDDDMLARRFSRCARPPSRALYPKIRAEILRILRERASEETPGVPTVKVEYMPWDGERITVPLSIGNQLMKNASASDCGSIGWVTEIKDTSRNGTAGTWVTLEHPGSSSCSTSYWLADDIAHWFIKID